MKYVVLMVFAGLLSACATEPFVTDEGSAAYKSAQDTVQQQAEHPIQTIPGNLPPSQRF